MSGQSGIRQSIASRSAELCLYVLGTPKVGRSGHRSSVPRWQAHRAPDLQTIHLEPGQRGYAHYHVIEQDSTVPR